MKRVGSFVGDWWRLVIPYFKSEDWPFAIPLLIGAVALTFSGVGLEVLFNDWNRRFYDSIQNKDEAVFWREIIVFSWLAAFFILNYVARAIVSPYLRLRWRRWLTQRYLAHWLDGRGYYRIELQRTVDNADQRIAEDLRFLGEYTMTLLLGLLGAVATLLSFLFILWELSGPLSLASIGLNVTIPGYMAWVCLIYAFVGTFLANMVGRRLISLNFLKQRYEANFRFALVRVRENAEGIALYHGEQREAESLNARFIDVFNNGWRVLLHAGAARLLPVGLRAARHHLPLCRDRTAVLCRRHHLRRHDPDRIGLRPGAVGAVVLHRQLHHARRASRRDGPPQGAAGGNRRQAGDERSTSCRSRALPRWAPRT